MLTAVVLAAAPWQQLTASAGALGRAGPALGRGPLPVGARHPCPLPFGAAGGALGPVTTAVASAAERCLRRLFSRRPFGSSSRRRRERSSERVQISGAARSRWAFVIHVPFLSGLRG